MKTSSKKLYIIVPITAVAALVFIASLIHLMLPSAEAEIVPPTSFVQRQVASQNATAMQPVLDPDLLVIPDIGVRAQVEKVGITANGAMATPSSFKTIGWYKYGPRPGEPGSAVMAGHVDNALALAGVFKRLGEVNPGDTVMVEGKDGKQLKFVVKEVKTYPYDKVPADLVFSQGGSKSRLNLITCAGKWLKKEKTYDQRLIVFTELQ